MEDAAAFVGAALVLSGETPALEEGLLARAQGDAATFRGQPELARAIGFYTWSPALEAIFAQHRYLQNRQDAQPQNTFARFVAVTAVLKTSSDLQARYQQLLALHAGMTNRFASYTPLDLLDQVQGLGSIDDGSVTFQGFSTAHPAPYPPFPCTGSWFGLFPASQARDSDYLCSQSPLANDAQPLDILIDAIRSGELDLEPQAGAGWYEYQLYTLETLLLTDRGAESQNLLLTAAYKKKLIETFKALITQIRETHVAHLGGFGSDEPAPVIVVDVYPKLPVEPFPTFYLRTARAYRFLETLLKATLGDEYLRNGHRLYEGHSSTVSLGEELHQKAALLYGLYLVSGQSIGVKSELLADELAEYPAQDCQAAAQEWLARWRDDADLLSDPRFIVPLGSTDQKTFYSATIGVKAYRSSAEFVKGHTPSVKMTNSGCVFGQFLGRDYYLLSEDTVQVALRRGAPPLTRSELRALCDQHQTREAIIQALEAR